MSIISTEFSLISVQKNIFNDIDVEDSIQLIGTIKNISNLLDKKLISVVTFCLTLYFIFIKSKNVQLKLENITLGT